MQIIKELNSSDIVILCLSASSLASAFVQNVEMSEAWIRRDAGKCIVIPVHLKPCAWEAHKKIKELQVIPRSGKAISQYDDEEEAWKEVTEEIIKVIELKPHHTELSPAAKPKSVQPRFSLQTLADHEAEKRPIRTTIAAHSSGTELAEVDILVLYPNRTCKLTKTDTQGQAHLQLHSGHLPMTVFAATPNYTACVERDWIPEERPLSLEMDPLPDGGAAIFPEYSGYLPGLKGRLNPIRDALDRTYLHTTNIAVNSGQARPVHFLLGDELHLTDADGNERWVRIIAIEGSSALVEYRSHLAAEK